MGLRFKHVLNDEISSINYSNLLQQQQQQQNLRYKDHLIFPINGSSVKLTQNLGDKEAMAVAAASPCPTQSCRTSKTQICNCELKSSSHSISAMAVAVTVSPCPVVLDSWMPRHAHSLPRYAHSTTPPTSSVNDSFSPSSLSVYKAASQVLVHGDTVFTAHNDDHKIRVWSSVTKRPTLKLLTTLPSASDSFSHYFRQRSYVQIRRHHLCLWLQHFDTITSMAASPLYGGLLYSASWDRSFKLWRLSDYRCMDSVSMAHNDAINSLVLYSHNNASSLIVYTASSDGLIKAWSAAGALKKLRRRQHRQQERRISTQPLNLMMKRKNTATVQHGHVGTLSKKSGSVNALALSSDGELLFSAGSDGNVLVWRRPREKARDEEVAMAGYPGVHSSLCRVLEGHRRAVLCLAIAGSFVISGSADKSVRVWKAQRIQQFRVNHETGDEEGKKHVYCSCAFCINESIINSNSCGNHFISDANLKPNCINYSAGANYYSEIISCEAVLEGHKSGVKSVSALPYVDGTGSCHVCSGGVDGTTKIWSVKCERDQKMIM